MNLVLEILQLLLILVTFFIGFSIAYLFGLLFPLEILKEQYDKTLAHVIEYGIYILYFAGSILSSKLIFKTIVIYGTSFNVTFNMVLVFLFFVIGSLVLLAALILYIWLIVLRGMRGEFNFAIRV